MRDEWNAVQSLQEQIRVLCQLLIKLEFITKEDFEEMHKELYGQ